MKILVPVSKREYIGSYIQAGADELYLGFHDPVWVRRFGTYADINRMSGFAHHANPYTFEKIIEVIQEIEDRGKSAFVTLNANSYSREEIRFMEEHYFPRLKEAGTEGLILSDPDTITAAVRAGLAPVASTMCAIYNRDIARFYYDLGVKRMILPRDLSLDEIERICAALPEVEFEAFFLRNGCIFSDCYCLGLHRPECGATCSYTRFGVHSYQHSYRDFQNIHDVDVNDYLYRVAFHQDACAMCALYRLRNMGITSLKIVGRADRFEDVCRDIRLTRKNLAILEQSSSERDYLDHMVLPGNAPQKCRMGFSCYYPEIRFGQEQHI